LLKTGVNLKYKVVKNSSHELVYQILEIADDKSIYQFLPKLTILDTSEKTVNYSENKLNPISATTEIYRGDDKYFSLDKPAAGVISGTKMKPYADIKKRGSVIVRYQDENGTSLAPEVLLANKVQVGTDYAAEEKQFEGFEKAELLKNSSPKTGKVEEGVKIVTFVYKKKSVPAPEKPLNPVKEDKKPKENISAPNTGFENNFIKNLLFMGGAVLSVISIIVIRKTIK
jgi:putative membrane protein